nr:MAG TPA: hypothetical protein [Caudoviricetes sp.]
MALSLKTCSGSRYRTYMPNYNGALRKPLKPTTVYYRLRISSLVMTTGTYSPRLMWKPYTERLRTS